MWFIKLIERIRETDKITPIVVYSGDAQKAHIENSLASGVNEYVVKPNWDELVETVKNLLAKTSYSDLKSSQSYRIIQNNNQNQIWLQTVLRIKVCLFRKAEYFGSY